MDIVGHPLGAPPQAPRLRPIPIDLPAFLGGEAFSSVGAARAAAK